MFCNHVFHLQREVNYYPPTESRGVFAKTVKVQCPKSFYDASLLHGIFIQLSNDYSRGKGFVVHEEDRGSSPALLRDPHIVSEVFQRKKEVIYPSNRLSESCVDV